MRSIDARVSNIQGLEFKVTHLGADSHDVGRHMIFMVPTDSTRYGQDARRQIFVLLEKAREALALNRN
jgi:hypothetical protein